MKKTDSQVEPIYAAWAKGYALKGEVDCKKDISEVSVAQFLNLSLVSSKYKILGNTLKLMEEDRSDGWHCRHRLEWYDWEVIATATQQLEENDGLIV